MSAGVTHSNYHSGETISKWPKKAIAGTSKGDYPFTRPGYMAARTYPVYPDLNPVASSDVF